MPYIVLVIYLVLSMALQLLLGNFPVYLMAFPLNLIIPLLWFGLMFHLWKKSPKSMFVRYMLSPGATFWSIFLFIDACIVIGLTGERSYTVSWVFIAILLFLQTVLFFVILRGCRAQTPTGARLGEIRWRFLLNHVGLLLALGAGFWGAPDSVTMRVKAFEGQQVKEAVIPGIGLSGIEHEILLEDFRLERYENGVPSLYEADLTVNGEKVNLRVNHPYRLSFSEMLYVSGYDVNAGEESSWCVMQIVHEPWRYWAFAGVLMMLAGAFMLFIQGPKRGNVIND
jgi:hypothetical protein